MSIYSKGGTHPVFSTLGKIDKGRDTRLQRNSLQHICEKHQNGDVWREEKQRETNTMSHESWTETVSKHDLHQTLQYLIGVENPCCTGIGEVCSVDLT